MSYHLVTVGHDSWVVELGQPSDPILVDGLSMGRQCADGSCRIPDCVRLTVEHVAPGTDWEAVAYETVSEERSDRDVLTLTLDQHEPHWRTVRAVVKGDYVEYERRTLRGDWEVLTDSEKVGHPDLPTRESQIAAVAIVHAAGLR
jgi:hypothetical protein